MGQVNTPSNLVDRIRQLERQVAEIRKRAGLGNASISTGDLTVEDGGTFRLVHPNGTTIAKIGHLGKVGGEETWGTALYRPDGSIAVSVYADDQGGNQFVALWDRSENIILSDDNVSGLGLAKPYLAGLIAPSGSSANIAACWPRTTKTTYEEVLTGTFPATHPRLSIQMLAAVDSGVAGSAQVLVNGTQVGSTVGAAVWFDETVDVPGWGDTVHFLDDITVSVQAKRNSGTGNVYAMVYKLAGVQS